MRGTDGASMSAQAMEVVGLDTRTMATRSVSDEFTADGVYLNTATMGLPPRRAIDALHAVLDRWQRGLSDATEFDAAVTRSRAGYAALVGVDQAVVAVGPQVSVFAGQIAASLPAGAEVISAANEFTSVTFPFWARGLAVTEIPLADIADALTERTALVAVSAVQSADGTVLDVDTLLAAAARTGTRVLLDTTQAVGWFPIDASRVDYTVCGGYKFLLAPRGTAFLTVRPQLIAEISAVNANWYAGERPWDSIYGGPLRLATNARRFDISPAWHSWVGQAASLDLLTDLGAAALHEHALGLANAFRTLVGLPIGDSAIVRVDVVGDVAATLSTARIRASTRNGRLRLAFHVNNTDDDVRHAADALIKHVVG
jgi:selenocysteine lyase/cysteine desulfurase